MFAGRMVVERHFVCDGGENLRRNALAQALSDIDFMFLKESSLLFFGQCVECLRVVFCPAKCVWNSHHSRQFSNAENSVVAGMDGGLTGKDIVTRMDAGCYPIPEVSAVFVAIARFVLDDFAIDYVMRSQHKIDVVECALAGL